MAAPESPSPLELVELGPRDLPLLRRLFKSMQGVFGEDELDDLETFEAELTGSHPSCRLLCVVALGEQPAGATGERPLVGGALWEYFLESQCFLYTYLFLDPNISQGQGTGRLIANGMWAAVKRRERSEGLKNRGVFVEMHDPAQVENPTTDSMDPLKRVKMFQHMGVRQVGSPAFSYFQPPLKREEGQPLSEAEHAPFLLGLVVTRRTDRDSATGAPFLRADTLRDFLCAFYRDCAGPDFESDPYYQRMISSLHGFEQVPLVEFDCLSAQRLNAPKASLKPQPVRSLPEAGKMRVVVVGAGLAGLACARMLQEEGRGLFQVTVLEARDRVGGRVYTCCANGMQVDLGAAWLHGLDGNILAELLGLSPTSTTPSQGPKPSDVRMRRTDYRTALMYDGANGPLGGEEVAAASSKLDALLHSLELDANNLSASFDDCAERALRALHEREARPEACSKHRKVALNYMLSNLESLNAACLDDLSARFLPEEQELRGGDHLFLGGAAEAVLPAVCGGSPPDVHLQCVVRSLKYQGREEAARHQEASVVLNVEDLVSGNTSEVECDAVVLTVPIGVLQARDSGIRFQPPLPDWKLKSLQKVGNGLFNKVALRWHQSDIFWPTESHILGFNMPLVRKKESSLQWEMPERIEYDAAGWPESRENLWFVNMLPADGHPVLVAMVTGTLAVQMQSMSDEDMVHRVLAALRVMFGPDVPKPVASAMSRWDRDEFARGSYAFLKKGWLGRPDFEALTIPLGCDATGAAVADEAAGVIFFAGEAMSEKRFGYMDGAIETGRREARRLISMYRVGIDELQEASSAVGVLASKL